MLIKCSKCGKMYDYEKYSGICPKCARYNRPDSREDMEQDLHERYDTYKDPRQHDWYRAGTEDAGRNTNRTSNQKSSYSYQNENNSKWTGEKKKRKTPVAAIIIIIAVAIVIAAGSSIFSIVRNEIRDQITDGWDTDYDNWAQEEEQIEPEYQNRIYVEYAWSDYVGPNMSDINWDDYYVNVSQQNVQSWNSLQHRRDMYTISFLWLSKIIFRIHIICQMFRRKMCLYGQKMRIENRRLTIR